MSPEQARGEKVDARTDIWSLGVVVYEMIAGRPPFPGKTPSEVIAAILRDEPRPLTACVPGASRDLALVVTRAMRKERGERHQTAHDLLAGLNEVKQSLGPGRARVGKTTSRSRQRFVLLVVALLSLAVLAGWFYWSRKPAITARDTILLADFDNRTGDDIFDGALKQGLAIQLQQSPFLNLFPEARMRQTLALMGRSPNERVTAEIAREICERGNLKALIAGSIAPLGSHYVITLEAINGQNGEVLAREQTEAESREQVLHALSQAATRLREELGESLSSIQRSDKPLEQATTPKLEAFKAWSLGVENSYSGKPIEAIPFYRRAVEIDPDFAQAYSVLSVVYWGTGQPGLAAEYAEKGYALRERVGEYENLRITNFYHGFATGDLNKRIEVLRLQKRGYPREYSGPADLALTYILIGQSELAVTEGREAIRLNPSFAPPYGSLVWGLLRLNRFGEAKDIIAQAFQLNLELINLHSLLYQIVFIESTGGDTEGMQKQIEWARGKPDEYVTLDWQTGAAAFQGQSSKAREFALRAIDMATRGGMKEVAARYAAEQATRNAVLGNCRQARADTAQALNLERGRASLPNAALALALCGEAHQAKSLVDELTKRYPQDTVINSLWLPTIRAAGELQRRNATQAVQQLQAISPYEAAAQFWPQYLRGVSYLKLRRGAEAVGEFQKILDHRGEAPLSILYPLAYVGKARAAALSGDLTTSRKAYQDFITLWKDADADLSVLIEAKKEY
jgi:tetratricopeptide (TPR) repeat protein